MLGSQYGNSQQEQEAFAAHLTQALHRYGTPAHRLEETAYRLSKRLGVEGSFLSTPTSIMAAFGHMPHQRVYLLRADQGDIHLEKLNQLDVLAEKVCNAECTASEGLKEVERIIRAQPRYGAWPLFWAGTLVSVTAACLFGGGWAEIAVSVLTGASTAALTALTVKIPALGRVLELVAALCAAVIALASEELVGPYSVYIATLSGLIVLLPGFTMTVALTEVATRHVVSGTARLTGAASTFLKLGFGLALGTRVGDWLHLEQAFSIMGAAPDWLEWAALVLGSVAFGVLFQAEPRETPWILCVGALGILGSRVGAHLLGVELGPFLGALGVTAGSNLFARFSGRSPMIPLVPGILLLVPGSVGYKSMAALLARNVVSGVETAFSMILIATAIVAGMLLANFLVAPKGESVWRAAWR